MRNKVGTVKIVLSKRTQELKASSFSQRGLHSLNSQKQSDFPASLPMRLSTQNERRNYKMVGYTDERDSMAISPILFHAKYRLL